MVILSANAVRDAIGDSFENLLDREPGAGEVAADRVACLPEARDAIGELSFRA